MKNLDLTKPVRCRHNNGERFFDVKIVYSDGDIIAGRVDGYPQVATWRTNDLNSISWYNFGTLENYEKPVKVKRVVYLHESLQSNQFHVDEVREQIGYNQYHKAIASVEVEFTIGEFAE